MDNQSELAVFSFILDIFSRFDSCFTLESGNIKN